MIVSGFPLGWPFFHHILGVFIKLYANYIERACLAHQRMKHFFAVPTAGRYLTIRHLKWIRVVLLCFLRKILDEPHAELVIYYNGMTYGTQTHT